ncbi:MAG: sigma-70 family RNA polymerase sigma factor [Myxococcota bacterium]
MTDEELCSGSRLGQQEAFVELVRRYQGAVCAVTYAATQRRDISEDLAQETFLVAWKKLPQIEMPDRVAGWLTGIARNLARRSRSRAGTEPLASADSLEDREPGVEEAMVEHEERSEVRRVLASLPERYREALVLYYRDEQSVARVAELLGITVSAAEQRLSRGRRLLQGKFERATERELARTRPTAAFNRRVAAALPVFVPVAAAPAANGAPVSATVWKTITMNKLISLFIAVLGVGVAGYFVVGALDSEDTAETPTPRTAEASAVRAEPPAAASDSPAGVISGLVVDHDTGAPIPGGVVMVTDPGGATVFARQAGEPAHLASAAAGPDGAWRLDDVQPGDYQITATAPGYLPAQAPRFTLGDDALGEMTIQLHKGGAAVTGVVHDISGGIVEGALVRARSRSGMEYGALSNADGRYSLSLPDGRFSLIAWEADYQTDERRLTLRGSKRLVDFQLMPAGAIFGTVVHRKTGEPVAGATVSFDRMKRIGGGFSSDRASADEEVITDAAGRFVLRRLGAAEYQLRASADHAVTYAPAEVSVAIAEQVEGVVVLVSPGFNASGKIVDAADPTQGIAGLEIRTLGAGKLPSIRTKTQADGTFALQGLAPGKYPLTIEGPGVIASSLETNVTVEDADVDGVTVELMRGTSIRGRVSPPGVANVKLALRKGTGGFEVMLQGQKIRGAATKSAADGSFQIDAVPPGEWKVVADGTDGSHGEVEVEVEVDDGGLEAVDVRLEARPSVSGKLVDEAGVAVADATVSLMADVDPADPSAAFFARHAAQKVTTDDEGQFMVVGVEAGAYRLSAVDRDGSGLTTTADPGGAPVEVTTAAVADVALIVRRPTGVVSGRVVDQDGGALADAWVTVRASGQMIGAGGPDPVAADDQGAFSFEHLPEGDYALYATGPRGNAIGEVLDARLNAANEIVLTQLGTVRGRVTANGKPVTQFNVKTARLFDRTFIASDGRFEIERVKTGPRVLVVTADAGSTTVQLDIQSGGTTDATVELGAWGSLRGRAVNEDGEPVAGLAVRVHARGGRRHPDQDISATLRGEGPKTDADGRFIVEGVGAGNATITLQTSGGLFGSSARVGSARRYATDGTTSDIGDITVLDTSTVDDDQRGVLGLRVNAAFERPRDKDDPTPAAITPPTAPAALWVSEVIKGGAAEERGLARGQRVVSINGRAVESIGAGTAAILLSSARVEQGVDYVLELKTDAGPKTATVTARPVKRGRPMFP